ncbi:MFS transporter [Amycolatopsis pithecellobii]|uniref:Putative proline/betaine transporter n=1 Tax=Amycolatopsis pithecellobii TaxID=664692 RepID=A0A6N7YK96_9PSEU|nr:MFS transporter [Amycolatopsis pithecellobii]MTD53307.1 MFS transporter [Amycolatopsis pithecellobii]
MSGPIARGEPRSPSPRQVAVVSLVGTTIEWYDFQAYGLAASLVFGKLFFPGFSPVTGTLLSFATFGVGFFARPLGSIVFGHLGDRLGRRRVLMASLLLMGTATVLIGFLPGYAQIGVAAPILLVLLRLCQGFGIGGEWGGAAVYAVESAPDGQRGRYGGWPQVGSPLGLLIATIVFSLIGLMPGDALRAWGWRIPFLLSAVLVVVGLYMRRNLEDTRAFAKAREQKALTRYPVLSVLRRHPRELLLTFGMFSATSGGFYMFVTFIPAYGNTTVHAPKPALFGGLLAFAVAELLAVIIATRLTDRVGRRPVFLGCAIFTIVAAYPLFLVVQAGSAAGIVVVMLIGGVLIGVMYGIPGALAPELFPPEVRYSGAGLGYQTSAAIVGGLTPVVTTAAAAGAGATWPVAVLLAFFAALGLVAVARCRETGRDGLRESATGSTIVGVREESHVPGH